MAQPQQQSDKRATRRFALRLPVSVRYGENEPEHDAQTRDVSARGICFYVDTAIQAGSAINFTGAAAPNCLAGIRVLDLSQFEAVAAVIDEYEFLADS